MNFFKQKPKTPGDLAKSLKDNLVKFDNQLDNKRKVS